MLRCITVVIGRDRILTSLEIKDENTRGDVPRFFIAKRNKKRYSYDDYKP